MLIERKCYLRRPEEYFVCWLIVILYRPNFGPSTSHVCINRGTVGRKNSDDYGVYPVLVYMYIDRFEHWKSMCDYQSLIRYENGWSLVYVNLHHSSKSLMKGLTLLGTLLFLQRTGPASS